MLERYWVWERDLWGHNPKRPDSTKKEKTIEMVKAADAQATMADLQGQAKDYQACRDALDRTVLELKQAQQRVVQLEAERDEWKLASAGGETGHLLRCARVNGIWSCAKGCFAADHATLQGQVEAAKAQHEDMITRNKILRDRPDLPPDRAEWHDAFVQMQQRVAQLESGCEVCRKRYDNLSTQYSALQADHARVLGLVQAFRKINGTVTKLDVETQVILDAQPFIDLLTYRASLPAQPAQGGA